MIDCSGTGEKKHGSILRHVVLRKISAQVQSATVSVYILAYSEIHE